MQWVKAMAVLVLRELKARRATWQSWHVYAEAQRQVRDVQVPADQVTEVVGWIVDAMEPLMLNVTPDHDPVVEPTPLRRSDGESVYRHTGSDHFTSSRVLEAEERLTDAAGVTGGFWFDLDEVNTTILAAEVEGDMLGTARGQRAERLYLQLMVPHHRGGMQMARAALADAEQPRVRALARKISNAQAAEIRLLRSMLAERGGPVTSS
jgi:hypothetical protein